MWFGPHGLERWLREGSRSGLMVCFCRSCCGCGGEWKREISQRKFLEFRGWSFRWCLRFRWTFNESAWKETRLTYRNSNRWRRHNYNLSAYLSICGMGSWACRWPERPGRPAEARRDGTSSWRSDKVDRTRGSVGIGRADWGKIGWDLEIPKFRAVDLKSCEPVESRTQSDSGTEPTALFRRNRWAAHLWSARSPACQSDCVRFRSCHLATALRRQLATHCTD